MTHEADNSLPLLDGYRLIDKIGAGGYGEVWSAEAPGGLNKAIKYVFGDQAEKRAMHEARALDKIRMVRHPFLLSLERIETIEGRLLIVTELADGSLRDRYRACVENAQPGIPREELLGYLHDAADALDFLSTNHDLAHLDIKPENLLLVAGHVKVADFGLVKSIGSQTQASLVGGMTPTYASPEVFRGTPARESDQYSLAILYQEMLTGGLPFHGENAAELTLQHMSHDPDLGSLSEQDRFIVARALSKDPSHRYESAVAFVDALRNTEWSRQAESSKPARSSARVTGPLAKETVQHRHIVTEVFDDDEQSDPTPASDLLMEVPPLEDARARSAEFPPLAAEEEFRPTPSLFIGIGGSGGKVLCALRSRIAKQLGGNGGIATLPMLLLDTDTNALAKCTHRGDGSHGLDASETISLPLRRPQEYRDKAESLLNWLGRRWLYNIPRSLKTEGIRPLGRLALIDHARRTFQRIRKSMADAVSAPALEEAREATGLDFREGLRVYIVSSVSGGTGGGVTLDIAYAVRAIADRLGISDTRILGIMTHSTSREATRDELARVNAYSWLCEYNQFENGDHGYPGDAGCGLPAHPKGTPAFDETYVSVLGRRMGGTDFEQALEQIAEYVAADALTPAQQALDACRVADREEDQAENQIRSFTVQLDEARDQASLHPNERAVIRGLIKGWHGDTAGCASEGETKERSTAPVVPSAVEFLAESRLDPASLATQCRGLIEAALGGDAKAYLEAIAGEVSEGVGLLDRIDRDFVGEQNEPIALGGKSLEQIVQPIVSRRSRDLVGWVLGQLDQPSERLEGVRHANAWRRDHLRAVGKDLTKIRAAVEAEAARIKESVQEPNDTFQVTVHKYFRLRLDQAGLTGALLAADRLAKVTDNLSEEIENLQSLLSDLLTTPDDPKIDEGQGETITPEELRECVANLDRVIQEQYLSDHGGLLKALATKDSFAELQKALAQKARAVVGNSGPAADARTREVSGGTTPEVSVSLLEYGGKYREMTLVPEGVERESSDSEDSSEATLILETTQASPLRITEISGVSLPHLASSLIEQRRDYASFAERTRTRRDVPWLDPVYRLVASKPSTVTAVVPIVPADSLPASL